MARKRGRGERRGVSFYFGLVLVVGGLSALGYVGWQLWGTNLVAERAQRQAVARLERQWERGVRPVAFGEASAVVRIPRFGADYVMPVFEGVGDEELSSGIGHFPGAARPGRPGNYALAGHRVTHGEPFRALPELRPGDTVVVETRRAVFTYRIDTDPEDLVVPFTDVWVLDPLPRNPRPGGVQPRQRPGQRLLTLTTCAELFHTDDRLVAFGHLVDATLKEPGAS